MLDGRQYRTKQPCETPRFRGAHLALATCEDIKDPNRSLLGAEQEQWLFDGFKQTDAAWNILGQEQLVAKLRQQTRSGEPAIWTDGWDGYPGSRQRMLDAIIANRVANPVFIGGDIHSYWATDLKANFDDPKSPTIATEFVGTSITSDPSPHETFARLLPENPHVRYFESRHRGYVAVDLTPDRMETRFQVISDRRDAKATVSTLHRFAVESGRPTVVQLP